MWTNIGEVPGNGIDDDNNGYIDDVLGYDFFGKKADPFDDNGHGTHCAGIVAAAGKGASGAAPKVKIMALKFLDNRGYGTTADAILAIDYAISMNAHIMSNSWGGSNYSKALEEALASSAHKNILVVAAAGNDGQSISLRKIYPAALNLENMLTVANINQEGGLHRSSNFSRELVHIAAPGTRIFQPILVMLTPLSPVHPWLPLL